MITRLKNIILTRKHQKPILIDLFYKDNTSQKPIVIFCHGYKGFKDWGAWDLVAQHFAEHGYFFVKFNFSHNGSTPEEPIDFPDLEAFGANNYTKELNDLQSVLDWITEAPFPYKNQTNKNISLIGHSRGGGIVTIKAAEAPKVTNVITWAGVSDYARRFPTGDALQTWKESGVTYVTNGRTKQEMPHYFQFYTDFKENEERLTIARAAKALEIPHLIIHGTTDSSVSMQEAEQLHRWNPKSDLVLVADADHVFGAKHPWNFETLPLDLEKIVIQSINFIKPDQSTISNKH